MGRRHQRHTYSHSQGDTNNQHRPLDNPQQIYRRPPRNLHTANNHHPMPTTSQQQPTSGNNRSVGANGTATPSAFVPAPFRAESDLPGFSYDPVTKKYYAILPNTPGQPAGSTQRELKQFRENFERAQHREQLQRNHPDKKPRSESRDARTPFFRQSSVGSASLPSMLSELSLGGGGRHTLAFPASSARRYIEESRMRALNQTPSYAFDVVDNNSSTQFAGCQFLDVCEDGKTLFGCWSAGEFGSQAFHSRIVSYQVSVNSQEAQYLDEHEVGDDQPSGNTYGLRFAPVDNHIHVHSTLIDMAVAPADADVTCLLYATARSYMSNNPYFGMCTSFNVFLRPIDHLTREEGKESMTSPIYNVEWKTNDPIWSCAFNSNHMRIGIGQEKCATIFDVLTEQSFKVSSGGRNVIAQQFSKEGDLLYLGRRIDDIWALDLRMKNNHKVCEFPGSNSTCFIHQMEHRPNYILTDNFQGDIKLWDTRACKCVLNFSGHKNSSHKVPCFVDDNERFIFAVGEDGIARGWSLASGELLCSLVCPKSSPYENSDFPRLVYSDRWGGVNGNSALILAVNADIHVHELLL